MNRIINHINILLVCLDVIGLGTYLYERVIYMQQYEYLLIIFLISISSIQRYVKLVKCHFCLISALAVLAVFIKNQRVDLVITSVAFAISVNLGYKLINQCQEETQRKVYESILNLSFTLSVFSSLLCSFLGISRVTLKIIMLVTTLPSFYLSLPDEEGTIAQGEGQDSENIAAPKQAEVKNKLIYYLNPMLSKTWLYSLGYSIGIYLNIFQVFSLMKMTKYVKYLIISLLILIETLTYWPFVKLLCMFMRSLLIFHYEKVKQSYECYFILVFIALRNVMHDDGVNIYLMVGYVVIAVVLWREEYKKVTEILPNENQTGESSIKEPLIHHERHKEKYKAKYEEEREIDIDSSNEINELESGKYLYGDTQTYIAI